MMKSLFPELERGITLDRLAERRERRQHARHWLRNNPGFERQVIKMLTEKGPQIDANMAVDLAEAIESKSIMDTLPIVIAAQAMWQTGKLWAKKVEGHPCGAICYQYGIRGLHKREPGESLKITLPLNP